MIKKIKMESPSKVINKVANASKTVMGNANDKALHTTETVVTKGIVVAEQWQEVSKKAIKGGLKLAANQQDLTFDFLEGIKSTVMLTKKRVTKLIA